MPALPFFDRLIVHIYRNRFTYLLVQISLIYIAYILYQNFSGANGYAWYNKDETFHDPYIRLKDIAKEMAGSDGEAVIIAEGGSAATAYARLQFEDMDPKEREQYKGSLLRYCELDTLAMAMVVEAWKEFIDRD